jgi:hypothetical protein
MIRTGITRISQLKNKKLKDIFGKERNISVFLYTRLNEIKDFSLKEECSEIILNRFNSDRNVIKRTYKNRFNQFDDITIKEILRNNIQSPSILDVGISDGRASLYFLNSLLLNVKDFRYTGSDLAISYKLYKRKENSKSYIITNEKSEIVEIVYPPFVWNLSRGEGKIYFLNNILKSCFSRAMKRALRKNKMKFLKPFDLLYPDFTGLLEQNQGFSVRNYNLLDPVDGKFNAIRVMNILHFGYFSEKILNEILLNLYNGLELNGLLIEGSNENAGSPVEGAIYKKTLEGFILITEPEKESRIRDYVISFKPVFESLLPD